MLGSGAGGDMGITSGYSSTSSSGTVLISTAVGGSVGVSGDIVLSSGSTTLGALTLISLYYICGQNVVY